MLRQWRLTPTAFALLPEDEQATLIGLELARARRLDEWRKALQGDEGGKSNYTPEAATLLMLEGL